MIFAIVLKRYPDLKKQFKSQQYQRGFKTAEQYLKFLLDEDLKKMTTDKIIYRY